MSPYEMDMKEEKEPKVKKLLPVGWRKFQLVSGKETKSKAGNDMFVFEICDTKTDYIEDIYLVSVKGKRWMLKSLLSVLDIKPGEDGVFQWDIQDVLNKPFMGLVEHEDNKYINREGVEVEAKQHRIVKFKDMKDEQDVGWDD